MDKQLVDTIVPVNGSIDENGKIRDEVRKSAKELITGVIEQDYISFLIDFFPDAVEAFFDDYCVNGDSRTPREFIVYFKDKKQEMRSIFFNYRNIKHLLGFSDSGNKRYNSGDENKSYMDTRLVAELRQNDKTLDQTLSQTNSFFKQVRSIFCKQNESEIISHESNPSNKDLEKLNYYKVALKLFDFLNIGELTNGDNYWFKEDLTNGGRNQGFGNQKCKYMLIRSLRNSNLENQQYFNDTSNQNDLLYKLQLCIVFVEDSNGSLVPETIDLISKDLDNNGYRRPWFQYGLIKLAEYDMFNYQNHPFKFLGRVTIKDAGLGFNISAGSSVSVGPGLKGGSN